MLEKSNREVLEGVNVERMRDRIGSKDSEIYLKTLIRTIPDLAWLKDPEGVYLFCNSRFEYFFGAKEEDIVGKTDYDFVDKALADFFRENDKLAIAKGEPSKNEEEVTFAVDGHREILETIKTPIYSDDSRLIGVLGIGRDITERKLAERERLANLDFFESLDRINRAMQGTNDIEQMMSGALDTIMSSFNCDRVFLLYPCDPESSSMEIPMERSPEYPGAAELGTKLPVRPLTKDLFKRLLGTDGTVELNMGREINPNEEPWKQFHIKSVLAIALHPKVGKPWMLGAHQCSYGRIWTAQEKRLFKEISRRIADGLTSLLVYRDLQKSEARFRAIFETAADPIFLNDLQTGVFVDANPAAYHHLGYDPSELATLSLAHIQDNGSFDPIAHFSSLPNHDESIYFESTHKRKDGSKAIVEVSSRRLPSQEVQEGETLLSLIRDVTERKQNEAELVRYRDDLEQMVDERTAQLKAAQSELIKKEKLSVLGKLTAMVSHELRNPLGVIRTSNFFLQRKIQNMDEKTDKHLRRIDEQVSLCDAIVADMLEYTRGRRVSVVRSDLVMWLTKVVREMEVQKQVTIELEIDDHLPSILHDEEKMRRVVIKLLTNAVDAVSSKAKAEEIKVFPSLFVPKIEVQAYLQKETLEIVVSDNGTGMDEETCRQAFEPLFTTRARGTGIGLAIVKKIVEEHFGHITLDSRLGEGTRIAITLPTGLVKSTVN